jgi:YVTN family beta-propeller protein
VAASANFYDAESFEEVGRLELGTGTCAIGIVPERGEAFIVNSIAGTVSRVDLDAIEIMEEIRTGQAPVGLTVAPAHDRVYVTNRGAGSLSVLGVADGREWSQIPVGNGPGGVVVDPHDGRILVANAGSQTMSIVEDLLAAKPPAPVFEEPSPWLGNKLPAFALEDYWSGERRTNHDWAEKKYILNFFASW